MRICPIIDEFKGAGALKHRKHFLCYAFRVYALFRQHLNLYRHETSKAAQALGLAREGWQRPSPPTNQSRQLDQTQSFVLAVLPTISKTSIHEAPRRSYKVHWKSASMIFVAVLRVIYSARTYMIQATYRDSDSKIQYGGIGSNVHPSTTASRPHRP